MQHLIIIIHIQIHNPLVVVVIYMRLVKHT